MLLGMTATIAARRHSIYRFFSCVILAPSTSRVASEAGTTTALRNVAYVAGEACVKRNERRMMRRGVHVSRGREEAELSSAVSVPRVRRFSASDGGAGSCDAEAEAEAAAEVEREVNGSGGGVDETEAAIVEAGVESGRG